MKTFDDYIAMNLEHKPDGDRPHRSEAEQQLYWSTFQREVSGQAPAPQGIGHVWMDMRRLIAALRS
jgi:hypothetical protein